MARKQTNIRRRGKSWVVYFRANGKQVWKSFKTKDEAELYLARYLPTSERDKYQAPVKVTFSEAAEEWHAHAEGPRGPWKRSTKVDYRSVLDCHLLPEFGSLYLEQVSARMIERWRDDKMRGGLSRRNAVKLIAVLHSIYERARRVYRAAGNPAAEVAPLAQTYDAGRYDFYSPEEIHALVRAVASEEDGALYLTAAFTGLRRGELLALRWRDVDFEGEAIRVYGSVSFGELTTPKSGKVRSVPMVAEVASALAKLGQRERFAGPDEPVFPGEGGGYADGSALRRRYEAARKRAGLRALRFHDLRHTFGSLAINFGSLVEVQHWMGHADAKTTMRYLHYKNRGDEAARLGAAFQTASTLQASALNMAATPFHTDASEEPENVVPIAVSRNDVERRSA
jgi:integrase